MSLLEFKIPYKPTDPVAIAPLKEYTYDGARVALKQVLDSG